METALNIIIAIVVFYIGGLVGARNPQKFIWSSRKLKELASKVGNAAVERAKIGK